MSATETLEFALIRYLKELRELLAFNNIPQMRLDIEVSGNPNVGELRITYVLSWQGYGDHNAVRGNNLDAVANELVRRWYWKQGNDVLLLTNTGEVQRGNDAPVPHREDSEF